MKSKFRNLHKVKFNFKEIDEGKGLEKEVKDLIADKKDEYNQIKLNKEIKKVLLYRDKINNKPIDTSVLLKPQKKNASYEI